MNQTTNSASAATVAALDAKPTPVAEAVKPTSTSSTPVRQTHIRSAVGPAPIRPRHRLMLLSFVLVALLPGFLTAGYMWLVAHDQYHSTVSFTVQAESSQSAVGLFSGLTQMVGGTSSASDQEILYQYIRSADLVADLDATLDLRAIYSRHWPGDPFFAFNPKGTIEDLHSFWLSQVSVNQDNSGLITVKVNAPSALDAQNLTQKVFDLSAVLINRIASATRNDAVGYARNELRVAEERLSKARQELSRFRLRTQIVDPTADVQGQMGIINTLQARLADTMIEIDNLPVSSSAIDPRRAQLEQTRASIERLITEERRKFGEGGKGPGGEDYATLFSEYERLSANMMFAESTYQAAVAGYDTVISSAARQARYLVAHVRPSLAEKSLYPQRKLLTFIGFSIGFMLWALGLLVYYSVRDRR